MENESGSSTASDMVELTPGSAPRMMPNSTPTTLRPSAVGSVNTIAMALRISPIIGQ